MIQCMYSEAIMYQSEQNPSVYWFVALMSNETKLLNNNKLIIVEWNSNVISCNLVGDKFYD